MKYYFFSIFYIPLRKFAGGYHAKTPKQCFILSTIMLVCVLFLIEVIENLSLIYPLYIITFLSGILIFLKAPCECEHRKLNEKERHIFGKITKQILIVELAVCFILMPFDLNVAISGAVAIWSCATMLMLSILYSKGIKMKK